MTIAEIYNNAKLNPSEIKQMSTWLFSECDDGLYEFYDSTAFEKLYAYFAFETAQMPYGTATADTGEPDLWILEKLEEINESR